MKHQTHFTSEQFQQLLDDDLGAAEIDQCEVHLQACTECRTQLEEVAGDESWWRKAHSHLSSDELIAPGYGDFLDSIVIETEENTSDPSNPERLPDEDPVAALDPPRHPEILGRIADFDIEEVIGQGGMGIVYKAYDQDLNRAVAIKVLAPHLAANGVARKRFAREAQAAAAVVHPNVVPIYSVNSSARPHIVMALAAGRSLQDYVSQNGPLHVKDIVRIGRQIAAGLAAAHRHGLIHRDIKPANILLERDVSRVMITDFGLARAADDVAITQTGWLAGTPHYMSPEQAKGEDLDSKSDLFSLGSVLYYLATGREPFRAEKPFAVLQKIIAKQPMPVTRLNSEIPETLDRIIHRLLEKESQNRFATADEVESVMERYLAHLQDPAHRTKPKIRVKSTNVRRSMIACACVGLAATVMFFAIPWIQKSPNEDAGETKNPDQNVLVEFELQPYDQWVHEIQNLDQEISAFEQQQQTRELTPGTDDIPLELNRLNEQMDHLEIQLQTLP